MEFDEISHHETFSIHVSLQFSRSLLCAFPITLWCTITLITGRQMTIEFCVTQFMSVKNMFMTFHIIYGFVS